MYSVIEGTAKLKARDSRLLIAIKRRLGFACDHKETQKGASINEGDNIGSTASNKGAVAGPEGLSRS